MNTWFISGCSSGLGRSIAKAVLINGDRAVVTARGCGRVADIVAMAPDRAVAVELDVTDPTQISASVALAEERFGGIDVLVNNAGYAYQTIVEEGKDERIWALFEANVFGLFSLTRAVLPIMRKQRRGHILNMSSVAGLFGLPGSGYYAATKHAIEGWSDALKAEVESLGIQVTCIEPGPFATDFAGRSMDRSINSIDDYEQVAAAFRSKVSGDTARPGDPDRAALAIIAIAHNPDAPRHLVLGRMGYELVMDKLARQLDEIGAQREVAISADFP